jgi:hypothetical protein
MAGNLFTIAGSKGTGSGAAGSIMFQTSIVGTTGTTLQTLTDRAIVHGTGVVGIGKFSSFAATRLEVVDDSLAGSSMVKFSTISTAATGNTQKILEITQSGANASQVTYGIHATNSHSGAGSTNYAGFFTASGGDTNYGVAGTGSTYGVLGSSSGTSGGYFENTSSGAGVTGISSSGGFGGIVGTIGAAATGIVGALAVDRQYSGTVTNDVGAAIDYRVQADDGFKYQSARIASTWTDVTTASRDGNLEFYTTDSASSTLKLEISSTGIFTIAQGLANHADDAAAAGGGIPVNGLYRNGSVVMIRVA